MSAHSKFSASSSARWSKCTASIELESQFEDTTSEYAQQGTDAHEMAAKALERQKPVAYRKGFNKELKNYVQEYVDVINKKFEFLQCADLWIERKVKYDHIAPGGYGTADAVVIGFNSKAERVEVHVYDLKFGQGVMVHAYENPQLALYAEGVMSEDIEVAELYDADEIMIHMHIVQPRLDHHDTWVVNLTELRQFTRPIKKAAKKIIQGKTKFVPTEEGCRWCKANAQCKARSEFMFDLKEMGTVDPELLPDEDIGELLKRKKEIIQILTDMEKYAFERAMGDGFPGFKIVAGRASSSWADTAEEFLREQLGAKRFQARKLIGITEARKLVDKSLLEQHIHKLPGKNTLAPNEDSRQAVENITADNFENVK